MTASTTPLPSARQLTPLPPLPRIAPEHAALSRLLGRGRTADLPALGAALTIWPAIAHSAALRADGADAAGANGALSDDAGWRDALRLDGSFGTLRLAQATRLLHALTGIDLDGIAGPQDRRWPWLEAAALGRLDGTPFAGTRRLTPAGADSDGAAGSGALIGATAAADTASADDGATVPARQLILPLTLRSGSHCIASAASADAACWLALLRGDGWRALAAPLAALEQLAPAWPLRLARHRLTPAQLRQCRPGDVIVPEAAAFDCHGHGALTLGPCRLRVRYDAPSTLTILALESTMSAYADFSAPLPAADTGDDDAAGAPADPHAALDQLPLSVSFELGNLRLTLAQLRQLGAGSVVELDDASTAAVRIVCAGRQLGRGEAVDVGGRLGIRVTDWDAA